MWARVWNQALFKQNIWNVFIIEVGSITCISNFVSPAEQEHVYLSYILKVWPILRSVQREIRLSTWINIYLIRQEVPRTSVPQFVFDDESPVLPRVKASDKQLYCVRVCEEFKKLKHSCNDVINFTGINENRIHIQCFILNDFIKKSRDLLTLYSEMKYAVFIQILLGPEIPAEPVIFSRKAPQAIRH